MYISLSNPLPSGHNHLWYHFSLSPISLAPCGRLLRALPVERSSLDCPPLPSISPRSPLPRRLSCFAYIRLRCFRGLGLQMWKHMVLLWTHPVCWCPFIHRLLLQMQASRPPAESPSPIAPVPFFSPSGGPICRKPLSILSSLAIQIPEPGIGNV